MESPLKRPKLADSKLEAIRLQLEFYFSDTNLRHDSMMSELTGAKNKASFLRGTKWVLADTLMSFKRMKELASKGVDDILTSLESGPSLLLEVDREEKRIRRFKPVQLEELEKDVTPCTIYVEAFALDTSQDFLREKFSKYGQVQYVSVPHFPQGHPIHYQESEKHHTSPLSQGYAFVEFSTPDEALEAYRDYNRLSSLEEANSFFPRVMMKSTWLEYLSRFHLVQKKGYRECRNSVVLPAKLLRK